MYAAICNPAVITDCCPWEQPGATLDLGDPEGASVADVVFIFAQGLGGERRLLFHRFLLELCEQNA